MMLYDTVVTALPRMALWFVLVGGVLYSPRCDLSRLAAASFPKRDLAQFCIARRCVPLYRGHGSGFDLIL